MPTYEYECEKCTNHFEIEQRITDQPLDECPKCRGKVKRLISGTGFILKGGGWYASGYSSGSNLPQKKECGELPACQGCPKASEK